MDFKRNQPTEYKPQRQAVTLRKPSLVEKLAASHLPPRVQPGPAKTGRTQSKAKRKAPAGVVTPEGLNAARAALSLTNPFLKTK